jgi:hypothetical protein
MLVQEEIEIGAEVGTRGFIITYTHIIEEETQDRKK